ncbi:hypothetical protein BEL04_08490 [Mucilaginibacter sp. PPCGB 2223]|uniref:sensor histidine kinase n=1 Tax=Mucilaginibacter sp. PPCGB 2223 TaxID=1886027 RepID=UPI000826E338|nr:histidine kinase [Mucilaginibacter sp. PPCGB 2223]OCX54286.1 hypothetical protein BEL04_08490 [Mucilaginibacter sp. PPCGB 2223]
MGIHFSSLSYKQKALLTEALYLFVVCILIPLFIGLQIFDKFSWTIGLVIVTAFSLPSIILFYRWVLPVIFDKKRYWLSLILFPAYIVIYELNERLAAIAVIHMPFIPAQYRHNLQMASPTTFSGHWLNQTVSYTCLMLLANTSLYVVLRLFKNQHKLYTLENDKLKLELTHLKLQVQPHFFFNTLNNLYSLSVQGSPKTSPMIADLSAIMRYVLYESQQEQVLLQKEVDFMKSYIELERIRHDNPEIIDFAIQGDTSHILIEPLLFLPLIENAFKHSLAKDIPGKYVKVVLAADDDELIFQITNPVLQSQSTVVVPETGGIGLKNVKKRIELLYPGRHQFDISTDEETFTVTLTIKLK